MCLITKLYMFDYNKGYAIYVQMIVKMSNSYSVNVVYNTLQHDIYI